MGGEVDSTSVMTERSEQHNKAGHETTDIRVRAVLVGAAILVAVLVVAHLILSEMFETLTEQPALVEPVPFPLEERPPGPRLQSHPIQDLQALQQAEEAILGSYGWIDREAGIVRIPIERAMELLVERKYSLRPREEADIRQLIEERPP